VDFANPVQICNHLPVIRAGYKGSQVAAEMLLAKLDYLVVLRERLDVLRHGTFIFRLPRDKMPLGGVVPEELVVDSIDQPRHMGSKVNGGTMNRLNVGILKSHELAQIANPVEDVALQFVLIDVFHNWLLFVKRVDIYAQRPLNWIDTSSFN
jgi:hypothetical protein